MSEYICENQHVPHKFFPKTYENTFTFNENRILVAEKRDITELYCELCGKVIVPE